MGDRKLERCFLRFRDRGDVAALGEAFDLAAPELMRVARHLGRGAAEAEDLVQATFLTALTKPQAYDEGRRVLPWLLGILALHAREMRRKSGRTPEPDRLPEREVRDPSKNASDAEFQAAVHRAVDGLPETYRGVLVAHLSDGLEPRQVADRFGLSPVAARVRLHRGMKLLRRSLPPGFALGGTLAEASSSGLSWPPPSGPVSAESLAGLRARVLDAARELSPGGALGAAGATSWLGSSALLWGSALAATTLAIAAVRLIGPAVQAAPPTVQPRSEGPAARVASLPSPRVEAELPGEPEAEDSWGEGRLVDTSGAPIPAARLQAIGADGPVAEARSASDGSFELPLPKGTLGVIAQADGFAQGRWPLAGDPSAQPVRSLGLWSLPAGRALQGSIAGEHAARGRWWVSADYLDWIGMPAALHAGGDIEQGRIEGVTLAFSAARYAKVASFQPAQCEHRIVALLEPQEEGASPRLAWSSVRINEGRDTPVAFELEVPATQSFEAHLLDAEGRPVPGRALWAIPGALLGLVHRGVGGRVEMPRGMEELLRAVSDEEGLLSWPHLPMDAQSAPLAFLPAIPSAAVTPDRLAAGETAQLTWDSGGNVNWTARIVDAEGRPIEGAGVRWLGHEIESTPDGRVELPEVARDAVELEFFAAGYESRALLPPGSATTQNSEDGTDEDWVVALTSQERKDAAHGDAWTGELVDSTGRPLVGVEVRLRGARGLSKTFTDRHGAFRFQGSSAERRLEVLVDDDFQEPAPRWIQPGDPHLRLVLHERTLGRGELIADVREPGGGRPAQLTNVSLVSRRDGRPHPSRLVHLGSDHVRAERLTNGPWRLWLASSSGAVGFQDFEVKDQAEFVRLDLDLQATLAWELMVTRPDENAAPEFATITLLAGPASLDLDDVTWAGHRLGERWTFDGKEQRRFSGCLPGRYRIELGPGGVHGVHEFDLGRGAQPVTFLQLEALPAARLIVPHTELPREGFAQLVGREEDGTYRRGPVVDLAQGTPQDLVLWVRPGVVDWSVEFPGSDLPGSSTKASPRRGSLTVEARAAKNLLLVANSSHAVGQGDDKP